ncbi:hypothetical protein EJB05_35771, partial [Eragrostis curvula]
NWKARIAVGRCWARPLSQHHQQTRWLRPLHSRENPAEDLGGAQAETLRRKTRSLNPDPSGHHLLPRRRPPFPFPRRHRRAGGSAAVAVLAAGLLFPGSSSQTKSRTRQMLSDASLGGDRKSAYFSRSILWANLQQFVLH